MQLSLLQRISIAIHGCISIQSIRSLCPDKPKERKQQAIPVIPNSIQDTKEHHSSRTTKLY